MNVGTCVYVNVGTCVYVNVGTCVYVNVGTCVYVNMGICVCVCYTFHTLESRQHHLHFLKRRWLLATS